MFFRPFLAALALVMSTVPADAAGIVSLNLCTDQLLVLLAPEKVAGLERLARDPALSFVASSAQNLPRVQADAEAVLRLHPDLVLAGNYGAQTTIALLRARRVRVAQFDEPEDFPAIARQTMQIGALLGADAKAAILVKEMWQRLAAVKRAAGKPSAIVWQARGWTDGPGSVGAAVLQAAGYRNEGTGGNIGIEAMAVHPPDLLVTETAPGMPSLATDMLAHPALRGIAHKTIEPALLVCGGPFTAGAVAALAE